jgi:hypothetical protein
VYSTRELSREAFLRCGPCGYMLLDRGRQRGEALVRGNNQVLEIVYEQSGLRFGENDVMENLSPVDVR